ncbi:MAG: hypothetical protein J0L57_05345 [Burkholderiales bacterium]|nr:hypothetical protein [Burkholderiales bacterium]
MRNRIAQLALLLLAAPAAAAPDPYVAFDHSSEALMSKAEAARILKAQVDDSQRARVRKLYPASKWGFVTQVEGGFTPDKICVVTARVMMVPRSMGGRLVFAPKESATTFAAQPGASVEQCRAVASDKLTEAARALLTSLIAP